jgi:hypothetical protein
MSVRFSMLLVLPREQSYAARAADPSRGVA